MGVRGGEACFFRFWSPRFEANRDMPPDRDALDCDFCSTSPGH